MGSEMCIRDSLKAGGKKDNSFRHTSISCSVKRMERAGDAPDARQRAFESAQGLHQPDEGQHIHQQRQGQAQLTAVGQEADAGADRGQRQHNKALIQVELYKLIVPPFCAGGDEDEHIQICLLYTSPSPRDGLLSRMPASA